MLMLFKNEEKQIINYTVGLFNSSSLTNMHDKENKLYRLIHRWNKIFFHFPKHGFEPNTFLAANKIQSSNISSEYLHLSTFLPTLPIISTRAFSIFKMMESLVISHNEFPSNNLRHDFDSIVTVSTYT
jgi:hypothetical protein